MWLKRADIVIFLVFVIGCLLASAIVGMRSREINGEVITTTEKILKANCWIDDDGEYHYMIKTEARILKANDVKNVEISYNGQSVVLLQHQAKSESILSETIMLPMDSIKLMISN